MTSTRGAVSAEPRDLGVGVNPPAGRPHGRPSEVAADQLGWALFVAYVLLSLLYVIVGRHWTDEGWYLNAARLVAEGKRPYLDFAFTQSPILPYLQALPQAAFGPSLWIGRLTSLLFAIGAGWLTLYAARRLGGAWGAVWAFGFFALNLYTLHFLTVVLTYPAAVFCLAAALACLVAPWPAPSRAGAALVCAALAVGVRFSALVAFAGVLVYGVWLLRHRPLAWAALLPGLVAIGAIFGPFWLADPVATRYNLLGYHVDDTSWLETLRRTAPYWVNFLPGYLAWTFIGPILLIAAWRSGWRPYRRDGHECAVCWLLGLTVLATTILHALPENPQAKYQTLIAPWASVLVGAGLVQLARRSGWTWAFRPRTAIVLVALPLGLQVAGNLALAAVQGGLSPRFSEIDVADGRLPIAEIEDIGRVVRDGTPPGQPVITLFTSVAVAADRPVLPGLEMSIFALTGSAEQADRLRLMTPDQLVSAIRSGAGSAVIAERDLRAIVPESVILDRYCPAAYFDQIGQFRDAVEVYLLRAGGRCP